MGSAGIDPQVMYILTTQRARHQDVSHGDQDAGGRGGCPRDGVPGWPSGHSHLLLLNRGTSKHVNVTLFTMNLGSHDNQVMAVEHPCGQVWWEGWGLFT